MYSGKDIRQKYLNFFRSKGYVIIPSSSLVPEDDSLTLFISSGMQPLVLDLPSLIVSLLKSESMG